MKKNRIFLAVLISFLCFGTSYSQLFVGGNFYFSTSGAKYEAGSTSYDDDKTTSIGLTPKVGFFLSDQLAVGAGIGFDMSTTNDRQDPETVNSSLIFNFNPFARYYLVQADRFSLFAEGGVNLGLGSTKEKVEGTTNDGPSIFDFTFYVAPAVSFDISDNFVLEAGIGGLAFESYTEKDQDDNKYKESNIDFGLNLDNIFFGAIYKF